MKYFNRNLVKTCHSGVFRSEFIFGALTNLQVREIARSKQKRKFVAAANLNFETNEFKLRTSLRHLLRLFRFLTYSLLEICQVFEFSWHATTEYNSASEHHGTTCPRRHGLVVRAVVCEQDDLGSIPAQTKWFFSCQAYEIVKINGSRHDELYDLG